MALHKEASAFDIGTDSVYVTGSTMSLTGFPNAQGEQEFLVGTEDAFVMRIDATLTDAATYQMTYLGGTESASEFGYAIAIDAINGVYTGGVTTAADFPGSLGGAVPTYGGDTVLNMPAPEAGDAEFLAGVGDRVMQIQFDAETWSQVGPGQGRGVGQG